MQPSIRPTYTLSPGLKPMANAYESKPAIATATTPMIKV